MVMSANATRNGKAAIVKYAVTGTQFQQLLRTYRIFILSGVSQPEFVADVAPHFQDFDVVSPKITTLEGFMQWVDECDQGRNPSPCSSERSARCEVTSPGSISLASSGRSSSVFELESNDALSPGAIGLERERRAVAEENALYSAPLPESLSSLFAPIAGPSKQSAFAPFVPPVPHVGTCPEPMIVSESLPSPQIGNEVSRGIPSRPFSPKVTSGGVERKPTHVVIPPSPSVPEIAASWLPSDIDWDRVTLEDIHTKIDLRTC